MFESAELGHAIDKETYDAQVPALREALLAAQYEITSQKKFPIIIVVGGVDGAGKGETVNLLNEWMDARHIQTHAFGKPSDEETARPPMWRFWRALPPKGKIGIFFGAWHTLPILWRAYGEIGNAELDQATDEVARFERMLALEGALVIKFWFHISKSVQKKRLKALSRDPLTRWRVTKQDWKHFELYDKFRKVSERALRRTSRAHAPWIVIEGEDERFRALTVGRELLEAMKARLAAEAAPAPASEPEPVMAEPSLDGKNVLGSLDLTQKLEKKDYEQRFEELSGKLNRLSRHKRFKKRSLVCVFEGSDAAGKGGAIRRVTSALDARHFTIVPIAAPTEEERAQPYLWRFWRHVAGKGRITIFDRSWYGRVLVERIEKFCTVSDWTRAYEEINDFEEQLVRHGAVVAKFWLHISPDEQLLRFKAREETGFKHYKITAEDWRNREKWNGYEVAVSDMVDRTSTEIAPWTLVESNDKYFARVKILETLVGRLEDALER